MTSMMIKAAAVAILTVAMVGCATANKKSPEELIKESVEGWKAAIVAQDIEKAMTYYSEKFQHAEWGDKAGAKGFLEQAKAAGYLEGIEVVSDKVEIKVDGGTGTAYPIDIKGNFGTVTMELKYTGEEAGWLITGTDASGM